MLAFAVSANSEKLLTRTFSDRLLRDFAARRFRADRSAVTMLVTIIAVADDELIFSDKIRGDGPCPGLLNRRQSSRWHGWISMSATSPLRDRDVRRRDVLSVLTLHR